ncbi:MAG: Lrp/AsnC family transcriptional regulator [Candidatus Bathyarchaeia archaeon]
MATVDSTDLRILAELVYNSKATLASIGQKLGLHPNVVSYRINKLENMDIIRDYTVTLNLEKLGLTEQVYLGASFPTHAERDTILKEISTLPQTVTVVSSLGSPESIVHLVGQSKEDIDKVISRLRELNVKIEYAASVIKIYQDGKIGNFLRMKAEEAMNKTQGARRRGWLGDSCLRP